MLEKKFKAMKNLKILKFGGDSDESSAKTIYSNNL